MHCVEDQALGLIEPTPGDPRSDHFVHELVRESIVTAIPPLRAPRLHLRIAEALAHCGLDSEPVVERFAPTRP